MKDSYKNLGVFNFGKRCYSIIQNSSGVAYFEVIDGKYAMPITSFNLYDNEGKSLTNVNQHFFMSQLVSRLNIALNKGIFSSVFEVVDYLNDLRLKIENDDNLKKLFKGSGMAEINEESFEHNKKELLDYLDKFRFDTFVNYNNVSIFTGSLEKESPIISLNQDDLSDDVLVEEVDFSDDNNSENILVDNNISNLDSSIVSNNDFEVVNTDSLDAISSDSYFTSLGTNSNLEFIPSEQEENISDNNDSLDEFLIEDSSNGSLNSDEVISVIDEQDSGIENSSVSDNSSDIILDDNSNTIDNNLNIVDDNSNSILNISEDISAEQKVVNNDIIGPDYFDNVVVPPASDNSNAPLINELSFPSLDDNNNLYDSLDGLYSSASSNSQNSLSEQTRVIPTNSINEQVIASQNVFLNDTNQGVSNSTSYLDQVRDRIQSGVPQDTSKSNNELGSEIFEPNPKADPNDKIISDKVDLPEIENVLDSSNELNDKKKISGKVIVFIMILVLILIIFAFYLYNYVF